MSHNSNLGNADGTDEQTSLIESGDRLPLRSSFAACLEDEQFSCNTNGIAEAIFVDFDLISKSMDLLEENDWKQGRKRGAKSKVANKAKTESTVEQPGEKGSFYNYGMEVDCAYGDKMAKDGLRKKKDYNLRYDLEIERILHRLRRAQFGL